VGNNHRELNRRSAGKIQVWANDKENHFAIRLDIDDHFRAKTDNGMTDENFVKMVDQTDFLSDLKYNWAFTLKHWTKAHMASDNE
jgi:hypothetical protein